MKINNVNITTWNAKQWTIQIVPTKYTNASLWKSGAAVPVFFGGTVGFKTLTLGVMVYGATRDAILANVSGIVAACKDKVELVLDNYTRRFTGYLVSASNDELSKRKFHKLTLQFNGYEHAATVTVTGTQSLTINNPGNLDSPARITLTPDTTVSEIELTGICRDYYTGADKPVTVTSFTANKAVVLDGISGAITQNGSPKDVDIWRLPSLVPGSNTITCDNSHITIRVQYTPMYA